MAVETPIVPRGQGPYEHEEDLPYDPTGGGDGDGDDNSDSSGASRPSGAGRTSSRDARPSARHRQGKAKSAVKAGDGGAKVDTPEALAGAEAGFGERSTSTPEESQESDDLGRATDEDDSYYNDEEPRRRGIRGWSRRKKAAGIFGGIMAGGLIALASMGIGPFEFIHFSQSLQDFHFGDNEAMMDNRFSRLVNYGRGTPYRNNLGRLGNRVADRYIAKYAAAGFVADFNDPVTGRPRSSIQSWVIDKNTPEGKSALGSLRANGVDIPAAGADGKIRISTRGRGSSALSRKVVDAATESIGMNKVVSWMGARLLNIRTGTSLLHPMTNVLREPEESIQDFYRRNLREQDEEFRNGAADDIPDDSHHAADNPDDPEGRIPDANDQIDDIVEPGNPTRTASNLQNAFSRTVGALAILTIVCALDQFGDSIPELQYQTQILPLIRMGTSVIATGGQIQANQDFNAEILGAFNQRLYDPETGLNWSAAKSVQAEYGVENPSGPDMPSNARPSVGRPPFFAQLDAILGRIPQSGTVCNFLVSSVGGWVQFGVDAALTVATDGIYGAITAVLSEGVGQAAGRGLEGFIQEMAEWLAGQPIEDAARGALFGNYANYGARLASNDSAISTGGVELSDSEVAALKVDRESRYKTQLQHKSFYARFLDPKERGSLFARTVLQNPNIGTPQNTMRHVASLPTGVFNQLTSSFGNMFFPKTQAVVSSDVYDYGFPKYGYNLEVQEDPRYEDPYENAEKVEKEYDLDQLNRDYGERCFGITITRSGTIQSGETKRMDEIPPECKDNNNEQLVRYRFYIADTISMKSVTCLDSDDENACSELGFGTSTTSASNTGLPDGDAQELAQAILDNEKIGKDSDAQSQLQSIVDTGKPCPSVNSTYTINTELLRVIVALGQNNTFTISSLHRGCTGSTVGAGTASLHWQGRAVDISGSAGINGVTMPSFEAYDQRIQTFINEVSSYLPANCELGVPNSRYQSGVQATSPRCTNIFLDTPGSTGATGPHVHIGIGS